MKCKMQCQRVIQTYLWNHTFFFSQSESHSRRTCRSKVFMFAKSQYWMQDPGTTSQDNPEKNHLSWNSLHTSRWTCQEAWLDRIYVLEKRPRACPWNGREHAQGMAASMAKSHSWDSGLPLSENFDWLSLTGAKIFAFEICLENHINFEEKNSVLTRFMYLMMENSSRPR